MEDNRKAPERGLRRSFEGNRLEEELWAMAYEHIWPAVQRSPKRRSEVVRRQERSTDKTLIARRA